MQSRDCSKTNEVHIRDTYVMATLEMWYDWAIYALIIQNDLHYTYIHPLSNYEQLGIWIVKGSILTNISVCHHSLTYMSLNKSKNERIITIVTNIIFISFVFIHMHIVNATITVNYYFILVFLCDELSTIYNSNV